MCHSLPGQLPSAAQIMRGNALVGSKPRRPWWCPVLHRDTAMALAEEASNGETEPCTAPAQAETLLLCPASTS